MIELSAVKRPAAYKGEVGLYGASESDDNDLKHLATGETVWAEITTPQNLKLLRFLWAIAQKLANGGLYDDKDAAMIDLKIRARYADFQMQGDKVIVVPRSLSRRGRDVLSRLADRFVYIVCSELLPDMPESKFRKDIEEMIS